RQTDDLHHAEDLLQETFTRLITFQGAAPDNFRAWIYTIARNLAYDYFRSRSAPHSALPEQLPDDLDLDDRLIQRARQEEIAGCLQRLSPEHREVVILRFYQDLKLEEIAEIVGLSVGTVKSRLFHALR